MSKSNSEQTVITPKFRASFVKVFRAEAFEEGKEPRYGIMMLFPEGTDLTRMKMAIRAAVKNKWGDKPPKSLELPLKRGDDSDREEQQGMIVARASNTAKPGIVGLDPHIPITDETEFYSGCWARASVFAYPYDYKGMKKGVTFLLNNIQKLEDDEAFSGGRSAPEDDFDDEISAKGEPNEFDLDL